MNPRFRIPVVLLILLAAAGVTGCSGEPRDPEHVVEVFFERLSSGNFEEAASLAESHTRAFLDLAEAMAQAQKITGEILDLPVSAAELTGAPEQIDENRMQVPVLRDGVHETVFLVLENGRWRVRLPESLF